MKTKNKKRTPKPETRYLTPDPLRPRRNGKIASLDRDTREALNRQLRDNHPSDDILSWLNAQPGVKLVLDNHFKGQPINRGNLAEWRTGGYRDWENQECAFTWWEKKAKEMAEKGGSPYQLGHEMAQIHAGEFLATLASLMATAPTAEARMKQLSKAMVEFRGWRRADYHAEQMALDKQNSQWRRERETQELELKKQKLELQRDRYERNTVENVIEAASDPKVRAVAENDELSYAEQVKAARVIMFGDGDQPGNESSQSGAKTVVENQGLGGSDGVSGTQKNKPVSNMSDQERKAFYNEYLHMLLDLNAAGEDLREIGGFSDAEQKHAALNAKCSAESASGQDNIEHPVEGEKGGKGEEEKGSTELTEAAEGAEPVTCNFQPATKSPADLQPSTCNLEPYAESPLTSEQANKVVDEWYQKARRLGGIVVNNWDVADLRAYLSQQPAAYYSLKTGQDEFRQPPARDPRCDPNSPWSRAWPYLEAEMRANEKN